MGRIYITNCVPQDKVVELKASQAANNFCIHLVKGGCFDRAYSILPPSYKLAIDKDENFVYFSNTGRGRFGKIWSQFFNSVKLAIIANKYDSIWFYNVASPSMFVYVILRFVLRKNTYVLLADHTPGSKKISYQNYLGWLISKCKGMISLSSRVDFGILNACAIPGIIPSSSIAYVPREYNSPLKFLFSGTLAPVTGFDMALKVFSKIPNAELFVSGNGVFPDEYRAFHNIHFMGMMEYSEYKKLYDKVDVCLNFRNPALPENRNNFPSKVLEYFSKNKIVVSTMEYPEIEGAKYLKCKYDERSIIDTINELLELDSVSLDSYTDNTHFLCNTISEENWKKTFKIIENGKC